MQFLDSLMKNLKEEILDLNMKNKNEVINELSKEMDKLISEGHDKKVVQENFYHLLGELKIKVRSGIVQTFKKTIFSYFI